MRKYLLAICIVCMLFSGCTNDNKEKEADELVIDIDLTAVSKTIADAELFRLFSSPADYVDKVVKAAGFFSPYLLEDSETYVHFVDIMDAANCCPQSIEFKMTGDKAYPDDFPKAGSVIMFTGVFKTYMENEKTYYYLETDSLTVPQTGEVF